ncbi:Lrp/AsnC ligand binding domain-containing protein [uncultured Roseobacter sp.]|uniref:Lrp/AsnC family transcriptional regulator n=1 Tax=uncultured Roseobacter sp. TaxID=114847 RepID=UPI0026101A7B|nr:Lrp/AsnC ligand binding domain-containing protein [uncultured Roseobacter sp.]
MAKFDLLIDCLKFPHKMIKQREVVDSNPSRGRKALIESGVLQDSFPNFFQMGFQAQAFVDIEMTNESDQSKVTDDLHGVPGVIMIYTVFGNVDVRCKVVGRNLKEVESVATTIRKLDGVQKVTTSIVVDEMDNKKMRVNWASLLEENREHIDPST